MRPHVEIVYAQDLLWHPAALGGTAGEAVARRLSSDEETGAGAVLARFRSGGRARLGITRPTPSGTS